jgi:hypothetical protein
VDWRFRSAACRANNHTYKYFRIFLLFFHFAWLLFVSILSGGGIALGQENHQ